jgi:hypothetical protein
MLRTNPREHPEPELEIVLGVKTLAGSNPASSANYQDKIGHNDRLATGTVLVWVSIDAPIEGFGP